MDALIDGKTYVDGRGSCATIGGTCKDYPEWVWSIQGNWYERATGAWVAYRVDFHTGKALGYEVQPTSAKSLAREA